MELTNILQTENCDKNYTDQIGRVVQLIDDLEKDKSSTYLRHSKFYLYETLYMLLKSVLGPDISNRELANLGEASLTELYQQVADWIFLFKHVSCPEHDKPKYLYILLNVTNFLDALGGHIADIKRKIEETEK